MVALWREPQGGELHRWQDRVGQLAAAGPPPPPPPPTPVVSAINPNPVPGLDGYQTLTLTGSGFAPGAQVTLRTGGEVFVIPPDRTAVVNPTQIQVRVNVTRQAAPWTAEVANPGNRISNRAAFNVVAQPPPLATGQILGVQPQASPEGVALAARVRTTGPLYLG
jgi:hypothetical protein